MHQCSDPEAKGGCQLAGKQVRMWSQLSDHRLDKEGALWLSEANLCQGITEMWASWGNNDKTKR